MVVYLLFSVPSLPSSILFCQVGAGIQQTSVTSFPCQLASCEVPRNGKPQGTGISEAKNSFLFPVPAFLYSVVAESRKLAAVGSSKIWVSLVPTLCSFCLPISLLPIPNIKPTALSAWTLADRGPDTGNHLREQALKNTILRFICFELRAELFANGKWERVIYGMRWRYDSLNYPLFSLGWSASRRQGFGDTLTAA